MEHELVVLIERGIGTQGFGLCIVGGQLMRCKGCYPKLRKVCTNNMSTMLSKLHRYKDRGMHAQL